MDKQELLKIMRWFNNYIFERAEDPEMPTPIEDIDMLDCVYDCLNDYYKLLDKGEK